MTYKGIEYCDECGGCLAPWYTGEENESIYDCSCEEEEEEDE